MPGNSLDPISALAAEVAELRTEVNALRRITIGLQTFVLDGRTYSYFGHDGNRTWSNERAVELPVAWEAVQTAGSEAILEVGNVLRHYFSSGHRVVDRYEQGRHVDNLDVMEIPQDGIYDLIVSVSTLEHVGHSEGEGAEKAVAAIEHLRGCLSLCGRLLFTVPVGYNRALDRAIGEGAIPGLHTRYMRRIDRDNRWQQVDGWEAVSQCAYGKPFPAANGLVIGELRAAAAP